MKVFLSFLLALFLSATSQAAPSETSDYFVTRFHALSDELDKNIATPRAAASLYRLNIISPDLPSVEPLAEAYLRVVENDHALPEVRRLARLLLADTIITDGHLELATDQLSHLGFATQGWLVGGFDNEGGSGHDKAFLPEVGGIDLTATYPGKERPIHWRTIPPLGPQVQVPVADFIRPLKNVTYYFATQLQAAKPGKAVLHFGTSGASKLWLNGELVAMDPDDHPARFDQHAVGVTLKAGANVVLLKVSSLDERPSFFLRASGESDKDLVGVKFVEPKSGSLTACAKAEPHPHAWAPDMTSAIAKLVESKPDDGFLLQDYSIILDARRPYDSKQQLARRQQEKAAAILTKEPRAQAILASLINDDNNLRRQALEAALKIDPSYFPARTALAAYYAERGFPRRALDEVTRAIADGSDYFPARMLHAEAVESLGLEAQGQRELLDAGTRFPSTARTQKEAARVERSLGLLKQSSDRYRDLLPIRYDDHDARGDLASLLVDAGDVNGVIGLYRDAVALSPTSTWPIQRLADYLSFNGRPADALALYNRLIEIAPDEDGGLEARGQHFLRQGDTKAALADFQSALSLKPQNPHLRDLVRSVQPEEDYAAAYLRDAAQVASVAPKKPPDADDDTVILADVTVIRVYANGLSSRVHQLVAKVYDDRGVNEMRSQAVRYTPNDEEVKVERARIFKKDGTVVEAKSESDRGGSESWSGMYFENRQRTVSFPNLEPGDTIEFTYRRDDVSQENMFADYFGDVTYLQSTEPRLDEDYVLIAPPERTFYSNEIALKGVHHTVEKSGAGLQILRWQATNVPRIEPEPRMPGWADIAPYLHVSTFKDWDAMAKYWWGLVHDQLHVTPEVAAAADEAVKGIPADDLRGRVRAVYDFVVTKTRYVGLEFGIHGFKPYKVDQILSRGFGDCKDKASLIHALLEHLGIKSNLVLVRTHSLGALSELPASLAAFNHAIAYVPDLNVFLDGTAEFSGSAELPGQDQGAQVLVVREDGTPSKLMLTPVSKPEDNLIDSDAAMDLASDGSAVIKGSSRVRGDTASSWRRHYEAETGRLERFEQAFAQRYPGAKAMAFDIGDPRAIEKSVESHYEATIPTLAQKDGMVLLFSPLGEPSRYLEADAPQSKRVFPVDLGSPWRNEFKYTVKLPSGYMLAEEPIKSAKTTPFGEFRYETQPTPDGVVVSGELAFSVEEVAPADYAEFRSFLEELDRAFSHRIRIAPGAHAEAR